MMVHNRTKKYDLDSQDNAAFNFKNENKKDKNIGKITQVIGAVLDLKFSEGKLPEINEAVEITTKEGRHLLWHR